MQTNEKKSIDKLYRKFIVDRSNAYELARIIFTRVVEGDIDAHLQTNK